MVATALVVVPAYNATRAPFQLALDAAYLPERGYAALVPMVRRQIHFAT